MDSEPFFFPRRSCFGVLFLRGCSAPGFLRRLASPGAAIRDSRAMFLASLRRRNEGIVCGATRARPCLFFFAKTRPCFSSSRRRSCRLLVPAWVVSALVRLYCRTSVLAAATSGTHRSSDCSGGTRFPSLLDCLDWRITHRTLLQHITSALSHFPECASLRRQLT
jgi:hypothetical protein